MQPADQQVTLKSGGCPACQGHGGESHFIEVVKQMSTTKVEKCSDDDEFSTTVAQMMNSTEFKTNDNVSTATHEYVL